MQQDGGVPALGMCLSLPIFPCCFEGERVFPEQPCEAVVASRTSQNLSSSVGVTPAGLSHVSAQFFAWSREFPRQNPTCG